MIAFQNFNHVVRRAQEGFISDGSSKGNIPFHEVIERAQEKFQFAEEDISGVRGVKLYRAGGLSAGADKITDGGKATYTRNTRVVLPSMSDFVCDVQKIARRVLPDGLFRYFMRVYFTHFLTVADETVDEEWDEGRDKYLMDFLSTFHPAHQEVIGRIDATVRRALAAAFEEHGLFPYKKYMNKVRNDVHYFAEQQEAE